jgi:hypothetical protein
LLQKAAIEVDEELREKRDAVALQTRPVTRGAAGG